jgi:biotin carboxyl carrier protein
MKLKITVHGVAYEVEVEVLDPGEGFPQASPLPAVHPVSRPATPEGAAPPPRSATAAAAPSAVAAGTTRSVASPIAGTVIELKCKAGDTVSHGQILLLIEAMKMKTSIAAPGAGRIKAVPVAAGDSIREGQILVEFE